MPDTILEIFEATARAHADRPAMARKRGGAWEKTTWREYRDAVRQAARALVATGVEPGQGVVILAFNRPEWYVANLATIAVGARPAGIYTNSDARAVPLHHGARGGGGGGGREPRVARAAPGRAEDGPPASGRSC